MPPLSCRIGKTYDRLAVLKIKTLEIEQNADREGNMETA
jgi:hypothetical protein